MLYQFLGIDHVQLAAPKGSEELARKFYGETLGMDEIPKPETLRVRGGVWFQCGTHQVHIGVQEDFVAARKAHPAFHVQNLADFRKHLLGQDVRLQDDDALEGADRFYVDDPFGNRLEFLEWQ
ncbi:glyoxalase [Cohnella pontilimi]|uniref:Glyoxalase n=1 Tax=Cohnella pontilimi TaxID=2564100 RepID=A0A4U0FHJ1_9BACL|nr:VOC family protein [Cohnella pontilimi]TJY44427.1 glyoxalase [Cohnella pontilimi]